VFRGDIILPGVYAKNASGFVSQGKSVAEGGSCIMNEEPRCPYRIQALPMPVLCQLLVGRSPDRDIGE
jgi:hypothetical protein